MLFKDDPRRSRNLASLFVHGRPSIRASGPAICNQPPLKELYRISSEVMQVGRSCFYYDTSADIPDARPRCECAFSRSYQRFQACPGCHPATPNIWSRTERLGLHHLHRDIHAGCLHLRRFASIAMQGARCLIHVGARHSLTDCLFVDLSADLMTPVPTTFH